MTYRDLKARIERLDPAIIDMAIAVGLTLAVCIQIWILSTARPDALPGIPNWQLDHRPEPQPGFGIVRYLLVAAAFMPLALRRQVPWLALGMASAGALAYTLLPLAPPAPTVLAPMIALYTLAANAKRRHSGWIALLAIGVVGAVPLFAFSSSVRWVAELGGAIVVLAAAALLGESERTRRAYLAEYEHRALEAERTREEEALRRVDEERIRIAREVHDIVAHSLSIVTVQANAAMALVDTDPVRARESISHVRNSSKQALAELRSMLDVLRTGEGEMPLTPIEDIGRVAQLVTPLRDAGITVDLDTTGELASVPAYASVSAYRIVQEALTNVVRHAQADAVQVALGATPDSFTVVITDNGGAARTDPEEGHGIRGMRERVEALGGTFSAGPAPDRGFRVRAVIPLAKGNS